MIRSALVSLALLVGTASAAETAPKDYVSEQLAIRGAVVEPLTLSVTDLEQLPSHLVGEVEMICHTGINIGKKENLRGVLLRDILERAQLAAETPRDLRKMAVIAKATDDYKVVFSWGEIFNSPAGEHVIVYFGKDGQPLGDEEGRIALISTEDLHTGPRHVRWLNEIEIRKVAE